MANTRRTNLKDCLGDLITNKSCKKEKNKIKNHPS